MPIETAECPMCTSQVLVLHEQTYIDSKLSDVKFLTPHTYVIDVSLPPQQCPNVSNIIEVIPLEDQPVFIAEGEEDAP